ncbi:MAG: aminotransferase [Thermoproteota archaeon]|nr:MAG: aminotransferase [Candidatus Korarchaeota archaeon]
MVSEVRRLAALLLIALLAAPLASSAVRAQRKVIAIDLTPGRVKDVDKPKYQAVLNWLIGNLTAMGYEVRKLSKISRDTLKGVDALVIGKLRDERGAFKPDEVEAIAEWFKQGGKFLWVGADSDYVEPYLNPEDTSFKAGEPNKILEAVGSHLRLEYASVEDPESNAGADYRVVSGKYNTAGEAAQITSGAPKVLFHGPTFVVGFDNGKFVPFEQVDKKYETVTWLYATTDKGTVVSHDGVDPKATTVGQTGSFILAAVEKIKCGGMYSKVLVTGESLIGDRNIFYTKYHGVDLQGPTFVKQAFTWGLAVEKAGLPTMVYAVIAIVVVVVAVAVVLVLRRRK